jgi:methionyl-tRNA synthetase
MAMYFSQPLATYFYPSHCAWPEQTLEMRCDYCGSHGKDFQCRNCGAPVAPKRSKRRTVEVTTFADHEPVYLECVR